MVGYDTQSLQASLAFFARAIALLAIETASEQVGEAGVADARDDFAIGDQYLDDSDYLGAVEAYDDAVRAL